MRFACLTLHALLVLTFAVKGLFQRGLLLLASGRHYLPLPSDSPSPTADVDAQVRVSVADGEAQLIALYDAVLAAHQGLAADLEPLRAEHIAHADAVAATPTPAGPAPTVGSRPQALAALIEAEQQAVAQRTGACEASTAADLARTVALIAASEAGHAEFLRGIT